MEPMPWPPLSVASAVLPIIRRELLADPRAPVDRPGPPIDVCAIVEDGMCGYELAPQISTIPYLIIGCTDDNIPRLRRTTFNPNGDAGLRLATLEGRRVGTTRPHLRRMPRQAESLYADWATASRHAWDHLAGVLDEQGPQWDASMEACRSLENALTIAGLHLAQWDPAVELCGLANQAIYGLPLHGREGGGGTLTLKSADVWVLNWKFGQTVVRQEFSAFAPGLVDPARQRDVRG